MAIRDFEVETLTGASTDHKDIKDVIAGVESINALLPLTDFTFKAITGSPGVWLYRFRSIDSRKWQQTIDFTVGPQDPLMTFDFNDAFRLSEFETQRGARAAIVKAYSTVQLVKFELVVS